MDEENTDHMVAYQDKKTVDQLNDDNYLYYIVFLLHKFVYFQGKISK